MFNYLIPHLSMQNVSIENNQKKSILVRSLPEPLSFISTVSISQSNMTIEGLDALVRAELDQKVIRATCKESTTKVTRTGTQPMTTEMIPLLLMLKA